MPKKYENINFTPPSSVAKAAARGLELRAKQTPSNRGGTAVGMARANQLKNRTKLSPSTVKRMYSFFSRHEVDKKGKGFRTGTPGYPSKGVQAWLLWGGDAGFSWSRKVVNQMKRADTKKMSLVFAIEESKDETVRKQVVYAGRFYQPNSDVWFDVTEENIDNWVANFNLFKERGIDVPVPEEHSNLPSSRRGTVLDMEKDMDKEGRPSLYAKVEFTTEEDKKKYGKSQVSLYSPPTWTDGLGNTYQRPITHLALTDYPVVPSLEQWETQAASAALQFFPQKGNATMLIELAKALGLEVADSTPQDEVREAITAAFSSMSQEVESKNELVETLRSDIAKLSKGPEPAPVISAGILNMAKKSRALELSTLVKASKISPAVAKKIEDRYIKNAENLTLALSSTDASKTDDFDFFVDALQSNEVVSLNSETTGAQALQFSSRKAEDNEKENVLTRATKAKLN